MGKHANKPQYADKYRSVRDCTVFRSWISAGDGKDDRNYGIGGIANLDIGSWYHDLEGRGNFCGPFNTRTQAREALRSYKASMQRNAA